jgi:hypothetical protein
MIASGPGGIISELAKDIMLILITGELNKNSVKSFKERSQISGKFNLYSAVFTLLYCPMFKCFFSKDCSFLIPFSINAHMF